jgi:hypothetical protein
MMLPSGSVIAVEPVRAVHPELMFIDVHVAPPSVDRHVSFIHPVRSPPPITRTLPSGSATLLWSPLLDHPELMFIGIHVAPLSSDRQVSFWYPLKPAAPPITRMLPSGSATLLCPFLPIHPELAFCSVQLPVYVSSPKNHAHPVGLPADRSVKDTVRGAAPEVGVPLKAAVGAAAVAMPTSNRRAGMTRQNFVREMYLWKLIIYD